MGKPSSGLIVRVCLLGLPIGIILLGAGSVYVTEFVMAEEGTETAAPLARPGWRASSVKALTPENLREHVDVLTKRIGERHSQKFANLESTRFYLESTLGPSNLGYRVRQRSFEAGGQTFANVEAELPGRKLATEVIVIGAHYDSAPGTVGADDNASGVAALLALAEAFQAQPQARSIRFVGFVNEEPPWFQTDDMGSLRYARLLEREGVDVVAMISLESLGYYCDEPGSQKYPDPIAGDYPDRGNFVAVVGNPASQVLVDHVHRSMRIANRIPVEKGVFPGIVPGVGWSDHWSFWQTDTPAVMITGTAPFRNPHYHRPTDRIDTLDFERLSAAVAAIREAIQALANPATAP